MKNIIIFGNCGSGKTTLATKLQGELSARVLDLDDVAWDQYHTIQRLPYEESCKKIYSFITKGESWIIEGAYSSLLQFALPYCNEIRFLNPGVDVCVHNVRRRPWDQKRYKSDTEQQNALNVTIEWIKQYELRSDDDSYEAHRKLFTEYNGVKYEYRADDYILL